MIHIEHIKKKTGEHCPVCEIGFLVHAQKKKMTGKYAKFNNQMRCDQFPKCRYSNFNSKKMRKIIPKMENTTNGFTFQKVKL